MSEESLRAELDSDRPYASKTFAEVVDDYVLVRGDLSEPYAREQLVREHEARLTLVRDLAESRYDAMAAWRERAQAAEARAELAGSAETGSQAGRNALRGSDGPSGVSGSGANRGDGA